MTMTADWFSPRGSPWPPPPDPRGGMATAAEIFAPFLQGTQSDPREEVLVRYTHGRGRFSPDKRYISLSMRMYDLADQQDGHHEGVWEAQFSEPRVLLARPAPPGGPLNEPRGPVEPVGVVAQTKGIWAFGDNSAIVAVGPALSHLIPLDDGSFLFLVSCAQFICDGSGRYAGAYGLKTSLGSTHVPRGVDLFGPGDVTFEARTVDTFRVVRAPHLAPAPAGMGG
jgi:hypothetical protein